MPICKNEKCNKEFELAGNVKTQLYCSKTCKNFAYNSKRKGCVNTTCEVCNNMFFTYSSTQKYCSRACRKSGAYNTQKRAHTMPEMKTLVDVIDCLPTTDSALLNQCIRDKLVDINMLIRKCLKLKIAMEKGRV